MPWLLPVLLCLLAPPALLGDQAAPRCTLDFDGLPDFPQPVGGAFAGVADGKLIVAGGGFFDRTVSEGGHKVWVSDIFVLAGHDLEWRRFGQLPRPLAYGGSVVLDEGLLVIGGGDRTEHCRDVRLLRFSEDRIVVEEWPDLPQPNAFLGATRLGNHVYVAGGRSAPNASTALAVFWQLDLSDRERGWQRLPSWDGVGRILPVVVGQDGAVVVTSGAQLVDQAGGGTQRRYLTDTHLYRPGQGWTKGADAPTPIVAAPAVACGDAHVLVFGGDDGSLADQIAALADAHPGFSRALLAYHTVTDTWTTIGELAEAPVTTPAVWWNNRLVLATGEDRPGHRVAAVTSIGIHVGRNVFKPLDYALMAAYLAALVAMGIYLARREKTTDDFFLGGRRVPWWAAGISIFGTQLSAITFMAIPAKAYATDWTFILENLCIVLVAPLVVYVYLPFFRRLDITSAYEYLERRFNVLVRLFGSVSFLLFQFGRMGIVLCLPAIALSTVTGLDIYLCIIAMGILCTVYTVLGGIEAVIWTDVLQVVVLMGGALLSLAIVIADTDGGMNTVLETARSDDKLQVFNWTWDYTVPAVWVMVVGNFFAKIVPFTTDQTVIQRYLTTSDERSAARAIWTNALLAIPAAFIFFGVGTALYAYYKANPADLNPAVQSDAIFPWFVAQQLPAGVSGIVIAGLFAAAMSSLDSSMNSMSSVIMTDFYRRFTRPRDDAFYLGLARIITVVLGIIGTATAIWMARAEVRLLWDLFLRFVGLFGGSLAGVFALGILTKRGNGFGALVGAVAGAIALVLVQEFTDAHFFLYAGIGICVSGGLGYVASVAFPAARQDLSGLTLYTIGMRRASS